jgi:AcrR family transcriptional regulator
VSGFAGRHAPRADAVRNRARVLDAARHLFATQGVEVPLDEIARHAGVGPGTVHRHFPTKLSLLVAVIVERLQQRVEQGSDLADAADPSGLFELLDGLLDDGLENMAVKSALAGSGFDLRRTDPALAARLDEVLVRLLDLAQHAGTAASELDIDDVKASLAAALSGQDTVRDRPERVARVRKLVLAGLRG